ncbi:MAG: hypothetical protein FWG65_06645 [Turicibacter sp.]|nr:hypothetical protein [Turicibacter sp.]
MLLNMDAVLLSFLRKFDKRCGVLYNESGLNGWFLVLRAISDMVEEE